jgi:histidinol dehydrogenase
MLGKIGAAGAIFLGYHTPEAAGDYAAGPSHVLPTGGAVRFASPLGVYDFIVRSSLIRYSHDAITKQADLLEGLARLEGLDAHARAVTLRRAK